MSTVVDVISAVLLLAGALLSFIAGIGLHRLPDFYARVHVATKPATLAVACSLAGAALQLPHIPDLAKLALAVLLQFTTAPVASHLLGRAAYAGGVAMSPSTVMDELAERPSLPDDNDPG